MLIAATLITLHYATLITLHYTTLFCTTLHYTRLGYTTARSTTAHYTTLHYCTLHYTQYTTAQLQLQLRHANYTTLQLELQLHYTTLHPAVVGEVTTATIATTPNKHNSNHLSVHQWIRSAIHASQQLTSPIVSYL